MKENAGCAIIDNNKVLVLWKIKRQHYEFPGGKLDPNETIQECAIRETKEEIGCDVLLLKHIKAYEIHLPDLDIVSHSFFAKIKDNQKPRVMEPEAFKEIFWMPIKDYKNHSCAPNLKSFCEDVINKKIDLTYPIITISGNTGTGKSTLAKGLEKYFSAKRIYVGGIRRELAKEKGMTIQEFNAYGLTNPETDVDVDKKASQLARELAKETIVIAEGRTQFHFIPESIKVYLKVDIDEGVKRVFNELQKENTRNEGKLTTLEEVKKSNIGKNASDLARYKKYYNIDHTKESNYDFVLDTTNLTMEQVIQKTIEFIEKRLNQS